MAVVDGFRCALPILQREARDYVTRYLATALSFHSIPSPGPRAVTAPSMISAGFTRIAPAKSRNSSQCAVGVTASIWALASANRWLDIGMDAASAWPAT